jgi:hypothetical protein
VSIIIPLVSAFFSDVACVKQLHRRMQSAEPDLPPIVKEAGWRLYHCILSTDLDTQRA